MQIIGVSHSRMGTSMSSGVGLADGVNGQQAALWAKRETMDTSSYFNSRDGRDGNGAVTLGGKRCPIRAPDISGNDLNPPLSHSLVYSGTTYVSLILLFYSTMTSGFPMSTSKFALSADFIPVMLNGWGSCLMLLRR